MFLTISAKNLITEIILIWENNYVKKKYLNGPKVDPIKCMQKMLCKIYIYFFSFGKILEELRCWYETHLFLSTVTPLILIT